MPLDGEEHGHAQHNNLERYEEYRNPFHCLIMSIQFSIVGSIILELLIQHLLFCRNNALKTAGHVCGRYALMIAYDEAQHSIIAGFSDLISMGYL